MSGSRNFKWILVGLIFALLWASASTATKIGLAVAQPLVISVMRFAIASTIMLFYTHVLRKNPLPKGSDWKVIAVYGLLNISIYLGCYVLAMKEVTAGIGALATATNPVFISLLSVFFLNSKLTWKIVLSLFICICGVIVSSWPMLGTASVTANGLFILFFSMISYSAGAIYISRKNTGLPNITINGWQTLLGGIFLLPVCIFFYQPQLNEFSFSFWRPVIWLAVPVSIFAAQSWLFLVKINPVKAGFWLFLCPLFGALIAARVLGERLTPHTFLGIALVIGGLLLSRQRGKGSLKSTTGGG